MKLKHLNRILVTGVLTIAAAFASLGQGRIALTWEVVKYDISVNLPSDPAARDMDAVSSLTLKNVSSSAFSRLTMRISDQATVSAVTANGAAVDFSNSEESTGSARSLQRIVTSIPSVPPGQTINVTVRYKINVKENNGLAALSPVGSQFLPFSFWYPTPTSWFYTGGADFAPIKIAVNGGNAGKVFSSGAGSGNTFELTENGQPFFVAGPYETATIEGIEMGYIKRAGGAAPTATLTELAGLAAKANAFMSARLGKTLSAPLRIVCVKRGSGFADSGTILIDDSVLERETVDAVTVQTIVEGIAKSYLGNIIKVEGDGYGVIREGLSRFLGNEFIESEYGEEVAEVERLQQRTNYTAISRRDAPLNVVSPVDGYYYTATANKGSLIWNYLASAEGEQFYKTLRDSSADGTLGLAELRNAFSAEKAYLDYTIDSVTQMNLMIGLPQKGNGQVRSALRNLGDIDASVSVTATTSSGKKLRNDVVIKAKDFGEAVFQTTENIVRVEVDENKFYPQIDYSDDVAPRVIDDPDPLLFIKREFDRQRYTDAEKNALAVLGQYPEFHDARILLARSMLAENKLTEARRHFSEVLSSKVPSPQSIAWAEFGLGEAAQKAGQATEAADRFRKAIAADAEYGATLGAVRGLIALGTGPAPTDDVKAYFANFDRAVVSNSKAEVQAIIVGGEVSRFAANVAGQAQQWATTISFVQEVDAVEILVATNVQLKLLNREIETGIAVFRLSRTATGLKLSGVEIFEVG